MPFTVAVAPILDSPNSLCFKVPVSPGCHACPAKLALPHHRPDAVPD